MSGTDFPYFSDRLALYENEITDITFGPHQIRMLKEHAATSLRYSGTTYYTHYYRSCIGIRQTPCQPAIDSSKELAAICPDSQEYIKAKNISDAEAVVVKLPNSSKAWVYGALMHFHYSGLDKAKEFLRRGIETISSRKTQERLNLWKALMIMEVQFGSREKLLETFEEALKHNNKKELCLQVLKWLIDNEKTEELEIIKERILKKFKTRKEVYLTLFDYYMTRGEREEGRNLLEKCLKYVPAKDHPDIL
ncbi:unnamed protein product [Larinioides sclopetarius]|uniref:Uncharacterized protein n=1 Tax=Larinioides sclopetarius TaxID=280406 RepID=A0AAV2BDZ6_9ARAC